jgi:hypothetical protein
MNQWWLPALIYLGYFMRNLFLNSNILRTWRSITQTNIPSILPVDAKNYATSSEGKSSKNPKMPSIWCHYCNKCNHNTSDCRANITIFKQQKKACFEAKSRSRKWSLAFLFKEINTFKRQLKPEKTAGSKKSKAEFIKILDLKSRSFRVNHVDTLIYEILVSFSTDFE